ncbi:MAG: transposase [Kiritimatiellia bacterium]
MLDLFFNELSPEQRERLSMIQSEDGPLARGRRLKERLKAVFTLKDPELAEEFLDKWIKSAQHCRIAAFVELQPKIRRHREHILNTIRIGLSNARIEATNNKSKLLLKIAYGFRYIDTMISLAMLFCSSIEIPWPGRKRNAPTNTGAK